jgi:hypothetical protein
VIQRFNVRRGRAAAPYRDNIAEIKNVTEHPLFSALRNSGLTLADSDYPERLSRNGFCLEEVPDFGALLPRAYEIGVPVFALQDDEMGATGVVMENMIDKRNQILGQIESVVSTLQKMMN